MNPPNRSKPRAVDWDQIKLRLAAAEQALASGMAPSPERQREILRSRAQALSVEPAAATPAGSGIEVVEFVLAQEHYAIEAGLVRELIPLQDLTGVPCTPAFVAGIINAHGRILTVIDPKKLFGLPESDLTDLNKVIILEHAGLEFGILADQIVGANWLRLAEITEPLPAAPAARGDFTQGVTAQGVIVIDARKLLSDPSLVVDDEVSP